ncbi:uncharacterized protein LY79DRAFT_124442 [Colletotrichum navitas]|uniref:Uncharacterized protein n=1 Tax=Colletotrichum navitas TaxID=681940 RepID=A0AAD8Q2V5_9PEZI|nr:uncharacterized protein LY79DRAFT_124442 [Colletotrichum navitas]KAK1594758.1 hypothetical protein LY79DRAFT_124442 [Colletotrichum navitas]
MAERERERERETERGTLTLLSTNSLRLHSRRCAATTPALMGPASDAPCTAFETLAAVLCLVARQPGTGHRHLTVRGPRWHTFAEFILFSPSPGCIGPGYIMRGSLPPPPGFLLSCFVLLTYLDGTPPTRSPTLTTRRQLCRSGMACASVWTPTRLPQTHWGRFLFYLYFYFISRLRRGTTAHCLPVLGK